MKVYVHLEQRAPEFTLLYQPEHTAKISDLIEAFVKAYNAKFGNECVLEAAQITITNERRKTLIPSSSVDKVAKDKEDLYVNVGSASNGPSNVKSSAPASSQQTTIPLTTPETSPPEAGPAPTLSIPSTDSNVSTIVPTTIPAETKPPTSQTTSSTKEQKVTAEKQPTSPTTTPIGIPLPEKASSELSSMISQLRDSKISNSSPKPLRLEQYPTGVQEWVKESVAMADRIAQQGNFKQAVAIHDQILKIVPLHAQSLLRMGELYFAGGRYSLAIDYFQKGADSSPDILFEMGVADSNFQKGEYMEAAKYYMRALRFVENSPNAELKTRVQVLIAKALYKSGGATERETALQIIMTILRVNEEQVDALHVYGLAMKDMGKVPDAMRVFLKILVLSPNDKTVKEDLAELLQMTGGLVSLFTELAPNPSSAPAYGFIATFIKEFGAVAESVALYKKALDIKPSSSSYCLNLVHTMEVMGTYREAFEVIQNFCKVNATLSVGTVNCAIKGYGNLTENTKKMWITPEEAQNIQPYKFDIEPQKATVPDPSLKPYDSDELDLLALFATIPKICYAVGALDVIPPIVKLIEPQREGRELHTTPIRNEMAYYSCVVQLMLTQTKPLVNHRKIYVAGDSHSLSPGWRTINVKGEKILLQPALVTGLKIWHLRPETKFFPKANFKNVIKKIPQGSSVIMTFGEIDCREGLLVSVEKCRYEDLDEAITVTLDIYMKVIRQLIAENKFTIYIHPPPPVLDPTRKQVKRFAKLLKERIAKEPGVYFLDIFDSLLSPDKDDLHAPYKFDGTHLDPSYISLLETALNNLPN